MRTDLQALVDDLPWHHSIDLGGGVVTAGSKSLSNCADEAGLIFDRVDLTGRAVLDVGAWNGYFSFEAKRRGATRVLATDSYCWSHPQIRGREGFEVARSALGIDVESREIDVADLSADSIGEFDVVLYLGVFYHRYDAIEALAKVAGLAKHVLIVETHLDLQDIAVPAMAFYPGRELNNDPTNWWGPNEHCMRALLGGHGFKEIEVTAHPVAHNRAIFHAWRSKEARIEPLAIDALPDPPPEAKRSDYDGQHRLLSSIYAALKSNWWRFARK
ncbi:MAG: class I SAM-dependent methyltransferase [Beijerinckiaceae bacterium]